MLLALLVAALAVGGCGRGAKTPQEAYDRFAAAVRARDGAALHDALDQETRWSWMTIRKSHREAYDIVLSNFPDGERDRHTRRFEAAAVSDSERALFATQMTAARWEELAKGLPEGAAPALAGNEATVAKRDGGKLVFRRGPKDGRWGFAGFAEEAELAKRRAIADLELVRNSAADYERAATRAGR